MLPTELARLSPSQRAALGHVEETVRRQQNLVHAELSQTLRTANCPAVLLEDALTTITEHARVVLHFHPDRQSTNGMSVAEALLADGTYRSQFETGVSSGSRTAFPGGARDAWERTLFGGAYQAPGATISARPKYGALELIRYPDGPWPRFGSCYFVLKSTVSQRTSFTFSGSEQPQAVERLGLIDALDSVMAPLLSEIAGGEGAKVPWPPFVAPTLGLRDATVRGFLEQLTRELPLPRSDTSQPPGRVLDTGIEAQVHGPVELDRDVARLVADPSFRGTPTGEQLDALCRQHAIPMDWHCGFRLDVLDVPSEFRGEAMPRLARRIARNGMIDASVIGDAEASLHSEPEAWRDWGSHDETMQHLKQLWHVLVHYGAPTT